MSAVLEAPAAACAPRVLELRRYALHPGQRDVLIDLFEREFVEPQEACGMHVLGTFRDLDQPDHFVWLRGFPDLPTRTRALESFYGGPVWRTHRAAANATMIDSDDVHLLAPLGVFPAPPRRDSAHAGGVVTVTLYPLHACGAERFAAFFEAAMVPLLWNANVPVTARLATLQARNDFPALPVHEGVEVFAWLSRFPDAARATQGLARIDEALDWTPAVAEALWAQLRAPPRVSRLAPTRRSRLRG